MITGFSYLEERLLGPDGEQELKFAVERLKAFEQKLDDSINSGLSPDDMQLARQGQAAALSSYKILNDLTGKR